MENRKSVLYVDILKSLYGLLKAVLLFYKKIVKRFNDIVFKLNPYDPCITKRIVNEKKAHHFVSC